MTEQWIPGTVTSLIEHTVFRFVAVDRAAAQRC